MEADMNDRQSDWNLAEQRGGECNKRSISKRKTPQLIDPVWCEDAQNLNISSFRFGGAEIGSNAAHPGDRLSLSLVAGGTSNDRRAKQGMVPMPKSL
eukprot:6335645-Amphidinium_carterae.1